MPDIIRDPDFNLVHAFIQGKEHGAINMLILKYQDQVFNFCCRFLGNEEDARDCSQEIFIKVFKNLNGFRFKSKFSSWIYRIMINTCNEMVRSKNYRQRKKTLRQNPITRPEQVKYGNENDYYSNPEYALYRKQFNQAFQESLDQLNRVQKSLIILRDLEGRSYDEISKITGLKTGTVKSSLARARYKMADKLKDYRNAM